MCCGESWERDDMDNEALKSALDKIEELKAKLALYENAAEPGGSR